MSIYVDARGHAAVRAWCEDRLDRSDVVTGRDVVDTDLGPTHVTTAGSDGPQVVVLPAAGENAAVLDLLIRALAERYRVAVVDLPGEPGLSHDERPSEDLVPRYSDWIDQVTSAISPEPVLMVAEGLGATVALCSDSGQTAGLVAVAPAGVNDWPGDLGFALKELRHALSPTERNADRLVTSLYGAVTPPDHDLVVEWTALSGRTVWPSVPPALLPNAVLRDWAGVPHRVLVGEHDPMHLQDRLRRPVATLMGSEVEVVPGARAMVAHEAPAAVRTALDGLARTA